MVTRPPEVDVIMGSGALTAWALRRPPKHFLSLLEVAAQSGGVVVVPTVAVTESTTGRPREDARINQLLGRTVPDDCTLSRARRAAALHHRSTRTVSAVDAIVAAAATAHPGAAVVTSDPDDLGALLASSAPPVPIIAV